MPAPAARSRRRDGDLNCPEAERCVDPGGSATTGRAGTADPPAGGHAGVGAGIEENALRWAARPPDFGDRQRAPDALSRASPGQPKRWQATVAGSVTGTNANACAGGPLTAP